MNTFVVYGTQIAFHNKDECSCSDNWLKHNFKHYGIQHRLLNLLRTKGFMVEYDRDVSKIIRKDHFIGRKGNLHFKSSRYPMGFEITFYQEINTENSNGGYYDFDKFDKMPYLIQKQFQLVAKMICSFLSEFADNKTKINYKSAEDKIKADYVESWHHPQKDMNFSLAEINGTTCEAYNNTDRDKKTIFNGDFKYFRGWDGYLRCGKVYHNINNMWWVIVDDSNIRNVASFELFDISYKDFRGRKKFGKPPKQFFEKRQLLSEISTKELQRELKRRTSTKDNNRK